MQQAPTAGAHGLQRIRPGAIVMLAVVAGLSGCATAPQPLPAWAIHVPPPRFDPPIADKELDRTLIAEMGAVDAPARHLSPEQIAGHAVVMLRKNRPLDAALLLSIASNRYFEEGVLSLEVSDREAKEHLPALSPRASTAYQELVNHELRVYLNQDFYEEMRLTMALWEKRSHSAARMSERLARLLAVRAADPSSEMADLAARIEQARTPTDAETPRPALAEAYHRHLIAQLGDNRYEASASLWLAATPFPSFLREALARTTDPFNAPLCRNLAARMAAFRADIEQALDAPRPETRGNAVMALALYGDPNDTAALEQRAATEPDAAVRLVYDYALHKAGKGDRLAPLLAAAKSCAEAGICDLAIQLLQWLPPEDVARIDDSALAAILGDVSRSNRSQAFAAVLLAQIGAERALGDSAVRALLRASEGRNQEIADWSTTAIQNDVGLDRVGVQRWFGESGFGRHALYLRLARIATAADLPYVRQMFLGSGRSNDKVRAAIVVALGQIPGAEAEALLVSAFREREDVRITAAISLANRAGVDKALLQRLAEENRGTGSALLGYAAGDPAAAARLCALLHGGDFEDRASAVQLAHAVSDESLRDGLWAALRTVDSRYYPNDAVVRFEALRSLLDLALASGFRAAAMATPTSELERKRASPR